MKNKAADANLDFNGQAGNGVNREKDRYAGNYASRECGVEARENFGKGPRSQANSRQESKYEARTPATFDKFKQAPDRASGKKPNEGPFEHLHFGNPDKINVGSK